MSSFYEATDPDTAEAIERQIEESKLTAVLYLRAVVILDDLLLPEVWYAYQAGAFVGAFDSRKQAENALRGFQT